MIQTNNPTLEIKDLNKSFGKRKALDNVTINVSDGEMVALIGPSGSGKSTLLRHISGLIKSDKHKSSITLLGRTVQKNGKINRNIRSIRSDVGFIFQQFNLVGRLTLLQNVLVGKLAKIPAWRRSLLQLFNREEKKSAMYALYRVGLHEHAAQRASTLSGGQQQRAAIARAMEQQAKVILADEPIASLDPESARKVMASLSEMNRVDGVTVLISLHQVQFALQYCPRSIALKDGAIVYDGPSSELSPELLSRIYGTGFNEEMIDGTSPITEAADHQQHENEKDFTPTKDLVFAGADI